MCPKGITLNGRQSNHVVTHLLTERQHALVSH